MFMEGMNFSDYAINKTICPLADYLRFAHQFWGGNDTTLTLYPPDKILIPKDHEVVLTTGKIQFGY